ncbi:TPA: replication initiation protein [Pasteurella multocida]|nr:replication initiation protein [Pasteurella multocida]
MKVYDNNYLKSIISKPKLIYCTDELSTGIKLRTPAEALKMAYIQANNQVAINYLVLDLDHQNPLIFEDVGLPPPNFVVRSRQKNTSHYIYILDNFITKDYNRFSKNLAYFAKIQQAYTEALRADKAYIGLIMKNPLSEKWFTHNAQSYRAYSLDELADFVELPQRIVKKQAIGEGRNCWLFEMVRKFAYKEVLFYKQHNAKYEDFYNVLLNKLEKSNVFENAPSLNFNELKAIAKSVAKWTWEKFNAEKFSAIQTVRSQKAAEKRTEKFLEKIEELKNEFS